MVLKKFLKIALWKEEICVSDQVPNPSRNNGRDEVNKSEVFGLAADA